jgi:hypothetical protein
LFVELIDELEAPRLEKPLIEILPVIQLNRENTRFCLFFFQGNGAKNPLPGPWKRMHWTAVLCAVYTLLALVPQGLCRNLGYLFQESGVSKGKDGPVIICLQVMFFQLRFVVCFQGKHEAERR